VSLDEIYPRDYGRILASLVRVVQDFRWRRMRFRRLLRPRLPMASPGRATTCEDNNGSRA
jgi:hypothetical protein